MERRVRRKPEIKQEEEKEKPTLEKIYNVLTPHELNQIYKTMASQGFMLPAPTEKMERIPYDPRRQRVRSAYKNGILLEEDKRRQRSAFAQFPIRSVDEPYLEFTAMQREEAIFMFLYEYVQKMSPTPRSALSDRTIWIPALSGLEGHRCLQLSYVRKTNRLNVPKVIGTPLEQRIRFFRLENINKTFYENESGVMANITEITYNAEGDTLERPMFFNIDYELLSVTPLQNNRVDFTNASSKLMDTFKVGMVTDIIIRRELRTPCVQSVNFMLACQPFPEQSAWHVINKEVIEHYERRTEMLIEPSPRMKMRRIYQLPYMNVLALEDGESVMYVQRGEVVESLSFEELSAFLSSDKPLSDIYTMEKTHEITMVSKWVSNERTIRSLLLQGIQAIQAMADVGIFHMEIKPENLSIHKLSKEYLPLLENEFETIPSHRVIQLSLEDNGKLRYFLPLYQQPERDGSRWLLQLRHLSTVRTEETVQDGLEVYERAASTNPFYIPDDRKFVHRNTRTDFVYMAPELAIGAFVFDDMNFKGHTQPAVTSASSCFFALGMSVLTILLGRPPHYGNDTIDGTLQEEIMKFRFKADEDLQESFERIVCQQLIGKGRYADVSSVNNYIRLCKHSTQWMQTIYNYTEMIGFPWIDKNGNSDRIKRVVLASSSLVIRWMDENSDRFFYASSGGWLRKYPFLSAKIGDNGLNTLLKMISWNPADRLSASHFLNIGFFDELDSAPFRMKLNRATDVETYSSRKTPEFSAFLLNVSHPINHQSNSSLVFSHLLPHHREMVDAWWDEK